MCDNTWAPTGGGVGIRLPPAKYNAKFNYVQGELQNTIACIGTSAFTYNL